MLRMRLGQMTCEHLSFRRLYQAWSLSAKLVQFLGCFTGCLY